MHDKRKWGMSEELRLSGPSYTPYGCEESTSIANSSSFASSIHLIDYSNATACTSNAQCANRRLHLYCKCKWGMSEELRWFFVYAYFLLIIATSVMRRAYVHAVCWTSCLINTIHFRHSYFFMLKIISFFHA